MTCSKTTRPMIAMKSFYYLLQCHTVDYDTHSSYDLRVFCNACGNVVSVTLTQMSIAANSKIVCALSVQNTEAVRS